MNGKQKRKASTSVLFEMLNSFVSLASNLNLSRSTAELGISRQTIRRHIDDLEKLRGEALFDFYDRKYSLTESGNEALVEAEALLQRAQFWTGDKTNSVKGLFAIREKLEDGATFYTQRHPLYEIWEQAPPLIVEGFLAWSNSRSQIEAPTMEKIRPFLVVHRKRRSEWICSEVGEKSAIATWHGTALAKSAVGTKFESNPLSQDASLHVMEAYETVSRTGGIWYDHISTYQNRLLYDKKFPVSYQRLVFCCQFPDGEPASAVLTVRTNKIQILGMPESDFVPMPAEDCMDSVSTN